MRTYHSPKRIIAQLAPARLTVTPAPPRSRAWHSVERLQQCSKNVAWQVIRVDHSGDSTALALRNGWIRPRARRNHLIGRSRCRDTAVKQQRVRHVRHIEDVHWYDPALLDAATAVLVESCRRALSVRNRRPEGCNNLAFAYSSGQYTVAHRAHVPVQLLRVESDRAMRGGRRCSHPRRGRCGCKRRCIRRGACVASLQVSNNGCEGERLSIEQQRLELLHG